MIKMTQPKLFARGVKLWVRFSLNGEVIKRSLNIEDTKANRKLADTQIIPQMLLKVHSGEFFKNEVVPTVKEMFDISLKMNKNVRKFSTQKAYNFLFKNHILPHFGNRKIDSIKTSELTLWQNNLLEKLSPKSVINARVAFFGIFEDALRDELISKNPFTIIKAPQNIRLKEIKPFSKEEIFEIIDNCPDKVKLFFALGFFTGMRTGEIIALQWENIDLINRKIIIKYSRNKGIDNSPKTISSIREIDIIDILLPYIENHFKYKSNNCNYIFVSRGEKPYYTADKFSVTYWQKILKKINLPYRNLYQMRHTFASMMISSGEDILWVSSMLGHKNSNITLSTYAKYVKNDKRKRGAFLLS